MDDNLLGYLMDSLDPATQAQIEDYLRSSPQARERLEMLRQALAPLDEDRDNAAPPPDLVIRTLARVAEHCCRELPRSPVPASRPITPRPFWRRADVLVAACLLLGVLAFGFPVAGQLRHHRNKIECQNNLREYFAALKSYYDIHGKLPNFTEQSSLKVAGMVAPLLHDAGFLQNASIRCPANGAPVPCTVTVAQIENMCSGYKPGACGMNLQQQADKLIPCYAYSLGYNENGNYHFPDLPRELLASSLPLMADRPPSGALLLTGNSPNHGLGQNVLYYDGHVVFATSRYVGVDPDDDIYLNRDMKVGAGLDRRDAVLGSSGAQP